MATFGDIQARWETRVVPNGWHRPGVSGADAYVRKYGRNIGLEKLELLRDFAKLQKCYRFADDLNKYIIARKL